MLPRKKIPVKKGPFLTGLKLKNSLAVVAEQGSLTQAIIQGEPALNVLPAG